MIRVDDPDSILFIEESKKDICRFCGQSDSRFKCSKCDKAKYCSKECQTSDWKLLKHKLICF
jgi:MinD superfamily P-loop ATPase